MNPFALSTPSVFVITSPFQAMCCRAAIKNLQIKDYKIIFSLGGTDRNKQTKRFLETYSMQYDILNIHGKFQQLSYYFYALYPRRSKYKRLFIGDFRQHLFIKVGLTLVSDGSPIVCLDDGNITVSLLNNTFRSTPKLQCIELMNSLYKKIRRIEPKKNLYTIYSDISNEKFNIKENNLAGVLTNKPKYDIKSGIYVIGTYLEIYCSDLKITRNDLLAGIESVFVELKEKYSSQQIIYIPHGRDNGQFTKPLCDKFGIDFQRPEMMVELHIAEKQEYPFLIVGFNSSALYNLKKMMPECSVNNILILPQRENPAVLENRSVSKYYQSNDIPCREIIVGQS